MKVVITRKQAMATMGIGVGAWRRARLSGALKPALTRLYTRSPYFFTEDVSKVFGSNRQILKESVR
jgi:hypothetical protein